MATVRITQTIRAHVEQQLYALYEPQWRTKLEELQSIGLQQALIDAHIPKKYQKLAAELNSDPDGSWFEAQEKLSVHMPNGQQIIELRCPTPVNLPARFMTMAQSWRSYNWEIPTHLSIYQTVLRIYNEYLSICEECAIAINTLVRGVMQECGSLRQVLEVWPTAIDFVPEEARVQHYAATEKQKRKAKTVEIDDSVKSSLIRARFLKK